MLLLKVILLFSCTLNRLDGIYTDNSNLFTIRYPKKWEFKNSAGVLTFLSPKETNEDVFQENVNVIIQDLSKSPMTIEQYTELTKKQVIANLGKESIIYLKDINLSNQKAKQFCYTLTYNGKTLKVKQYWFIKNKRAYLLTYTAQTNFFNKYEEISTEIINSIRLNSLCSP